MSRAVVKNPGESPKVIDLRKGINHLQELVGGYFTTVYVDSLDEAGITVWASDEGLMLRQDPNLSIGGQIIVGPVVFTGTDGDGGTVSLTRDQETTCLAFLSKTSLSVYDGLIAKGRIERYL